MILIKYLIDKSKTFEPHNLIVTVSIFYEGKNYSRPCNLYVSKANIYLVYITIYIYIQYQYYNTFINILQSIMKNNDNFINILLWYIYLLSCYRKIIYWNEVTSHFWILEGIINFSIRSINKADLISREEYRKDRRKAVISITWVWPSILIDSLLLTSSIILSL